MRYVDFRDRIAGELKRNPGGLTWAQLKSRLDLPYDTPCQTWLHQMEKDIGLRRVKGPGRAKLWKVGKGRK